MSMSGPLVPMSTQPGSVGCRCSRQVTSTAVRTTDSGSGNVLAPSRRASVGGSSTGSAAMLKAPVTGLVIASTYADAMSSACTPWIASSGTSGSSGSRLRRTSDCGTNGPRK